MQYEIDIGFEAELGEFIDGFWGRRRGFQRLNFVRGYLQIRERFRTRPSPAPAFLNGRVGFTGWIGSVFSVRSNEQTAVGQGHLISSKYNIGFVRHGEAVIIRSPRGRHAFVKALEQAARDGFCPLVTWAVAVKPTASRGIPWQKPATSRYISGRDAHAARWFRKPRRYLKPPQRSIDQPAHET